jgi:hypothetical protein
LLSLVNFAVENLKGASHEKVGHYRSNASWQHDTLRGPCVFASVARDRRFGGARHGRSRDRATSDSRQRGRCGAQNDTTRGAPPLLKLRSFGRDVEAVYIHRGGGECLRLGARYRKGTDRFSVVLRGLPRCRRQGHGPLERQPRNQACRFDRPREEEQRRVFSGRRCRKS